jgi:hypothetical protein
MINPEIWTDKRFALLDEGAQIFFVALFTQADDEGRLEWDPMEIKLRCFPASAHSPQIFENRKDILVAAGLAYQYEADGRVYLLLPGWFKTQKLDHPALSKIPDPADLSTDLRLRDYSRELAKMREASRKPAKGREESRDRAKPRSNRIEAKGKEDNGNDLSPEFGDLEPEVEAFLAIVAAENKTGKISEGRELTLRRELDDARTEFPQTFADALRETNRRSVSEVAYLRKVAKSRATRTNLSPVPAREVRGYLNGEKCAAVKGQEPNGWMTIPPRGKKMADLWPEHRNYGTDYEPGVA